MCFCINELNSVNIKKDRKYFYSFFVTLHPTEAAGGSFCR